LSFSPLTKKNQTQIKSKTDKNQQNQKTDQKWGRAGRAGGNPHYFFWICFVFLDVDFFEKIPISWKLA